jgi:hypothetical protein
VDGAKGAWYQILLADVKSQDPPQFLFESKWSSHGWSVATREKVNTQDPKANGSTIVLAVTAAVVSASE